MKFEKREITLNETDSLSDMYHFEKALFKAYEEGKNKAESRQVVSAMETRMQALYSEGERLKKTIDKLN